MKSMDDYIYLLLGCFRSELDDRTRGGYIFFRMTNIQQNR